MNKKLFCFFFVCIITTSLYCNDTGSCSAVFLRDSFSPRMQALGGAYTAASGQADAVAANPASITSISELTVYASGATSDFSSQQVESSIVFPVSGLGSFGLSGYFIKDTGFRGFDTDGQETNSFSSNAGYYGLSYANKISEQVSLGLTVKSIFESGTNSAISGDAGFSCLFTEWWDIGIAVHNPGKFGDFPLPFSVNIGNTFYSESFLIAADVGWYRDSGVQASVGTEYMLLNLVSLRAGLKTSLLNAGFLPALSCGVGFELSKNIKLDYSLTDNSIGFNHRAAISFSFNSNWQTTGNF